VSKEQVSKEQVSKEQVSKEQVSKEQVSKEQGGCPPPVHTWRQGRGLRCSAMSVDG
jgi:hypothetical protein